MIAVANLWKSYKTSVVLSGVNLTISPGQIVGLQGPNGCGKTTLMRCICGFTRADKGKVTVEGKTVGKEVDFAPSTGIIIETPGFLPYHTGRRNLALLASLHGKVNREQIDKTLDCVGLAFEGDKLVRKYSLGMIQRLGIAQAIMDNPNNLILDEPFNGLDQQGVADIHDLLQSLKAQGKSILLASHSTVDIAQACDIVYELQNGQLSEHVVRSEITNLREDRL